MKNDYSIVKAMLLVSGESDIGEDNKKLYRHICFGVWYSIAEMWESFPLSHSGSIIMLVFMFSC